MKQIVWSAYVLSLLLYWYRNLFIVLSKVEVPAIIRGPVGHFALIIFLPALCRYGSIIFIWHIYGFIYALVALSVSYGFSHLIFKIYLRRQIVRVALWVVSDPNKWIPEWSVAELSDEDHLCTEAVLIANQIVTSNVAGGQASKSIATLMPNEMRSCKSALKQKINTLSRGCGNKK
jgi:hypothetical protein